MKFTTNKRMILAGAGIVAAALGTLSARAFLAPEPPSYITAPVSRQDIEDSVLANGVLEAFKSVAVGAQVNGQLKTLHVKLGDKVQKGQLLAEIDPVLAENTLRNEEAQVDNLLAQKQVKQAMLTQYLAAFERQKRMRADDAGSQADLESARAQLETTGHEIAAMDAQIRMARIAVDTAKANLGYTRIQAPIDGTVISIDTEEGQTVVSNQTAAKILTLATLDTMTVKVKISEADVMRVTPGLTTYFTLLGDHDTRHYGKLRAIEPGPVGGDSTTSASSSSAAVYYYGLFEVPNPDNAFRVSMTAQVTILLNRAEHALCIPASALAQKPADGRATVRLLTRGKAVTRNIATGISNNVQIQVMEGLNEGDAIIVGESAGAPGGDPGAMPPHPAGRP